MPYYKDINTLFIHIPKTGGTTLEKYLQKKSSQTLFSGFKNNLMPNDKLKNISLQHQRFCDLWRYRDVIGINFNNIKLITIVRNPYDRIISDLFHYNFIKQDSTPDNVYNVIKKYLKMNNLDNHNIPQYKFICDSKDNVQVNLNKIKIFRTETLTKDLHEYGFTDYKGQDTANTYMNYLNKDSISLINNFYKIDFIVFNYTMI